MKAHVFYSKLEKLFTRVGKGDREISIQIGELLIPIKDIVWHNDCDEFHLVGDVDIIHVTPEMLATADKHDKSWLN
jgi:hypothetical protein